MDARARRNRSSTQITTITLETPLPLAFVDRIKKQYPDFAEEMLASFDYEPISSVHLHPLKGFDLFASELNVPWCRNAKHLEKRPVFTLDPLFHAGSYYTQESSSMFLKYVTEYLFGKTEIQNVLDLCAAPGGKSITLSSVLGLNGLLVSNEIHKTRNVILQENLIKWGTPNFITTCNDPKAFAQQREIFDLVLIDAPCSGEGMFRKDVAARGEWSEENVDMCATRQRDILESIIPTIKDGGYLVYSTCTFAPEENEENCKWITEEYGLEPMDIPVDASWPIHQIKTDGVIAYQFLPHKVLGEGFFLAVFKAPGDFISKSRKRPKNSYYRDVNKKELAEILPFVDAPDLHLIINPRNEVFLTTATAEQVNLMTDYLYVTLPGLAVGELANGKIIPAHALAMSQQVSHSIPRVELTLEEALQYLRKQDIHPDFAHTGWNIVTYQHRALGWIKSMANRSNNYYPKEWKIRMQ